MPALNLITPLHKLPITSHDRHGTAFATHDFGWLEKMRREFKFDGVEITNITHDLICFESWDRTPERFCNHSPMLISITMLFHL